MATKNRRRFILEQLEDRLTPSFNVMPFDPGTSTWTLIQAADDGAATIGVDGANSVTVTDGSGSTALGVAGANLSITMLNNFGDTLTVDLDTGLTGNLTINLGNGASTLTLDGDSNSIGGNLSVSGGTDVQTTELAATAPFSAGGSVSVNLGTGVDPLSATMGLSAGSNITFNSVNTFDDGLLFTAGSFFTFNAGTEHVLNNLTLDNGASLIGSNFTYTGGNGEDNITIQGAFIGGNVTIYTGNSI